MRKIDVFSPQVRNSSIMCESWQVYYLALGVKEGAFDIILWMRGV